MSIRKLRFCSLSFALNLNFFKSVDYWRSNRQKIISKSQIWKKKFRKARNSSKSRRSRQDCVDQLLFAASTLHKTMLDLSELPISSALHPSVKDPVQTDQIAMQMLPLEPLWEAIIVEITTELASSKSFNRPYRARCSSSHRMPTTLLPSIVLVKVRDLAQKWLKIKRIPPPMAPRHPLRRFKIKWRNLHSSSPK